jgi:hypothetical protein
MENPRFIELTSVYNKKPIYININMIGDIRQDDDCSVIGHLTHNNGGFRVTQDVEEILDLMNNLNN